MPQQHTFNVGQKGVTGSGTDLYDAFTDEQIDLAQLFAALFPNVVMVDGSTVNATTSAPLQLGVNDRVVGLNKSNALLLPANPVFGLPVIVSDLRGDCGSNPCTITVPGQGGAVFTMSLNGDVYTLMPFSATVWGLI